MQSDPFQLSRFVDAQAGEYRAVLSELRSGRKRGHWMWYIFPQLKGLGSSGTSSFYGITSLKEAEGYLNHPILGARLRECTASVDALAGRTVHEIFSTPDDLKFISSMTLFATASKAPSVFHLALDKYNRGKPDQRTIVLLEQP